MSLYSSCVCVGAMCPTHPCVSCSPHTPLPQHIYGQRGLTAKRRWERCGKCGKRWKVNRQQTGVTGFSAVRLSCWKEKGGGGGGVQWGTGVVFQLAFPVMALWSQRVTCNVQCNEGYHTVQRVCGKCCWAYKSQHSFKTCRYSHCSSPALASICFPHEILSAKLLLASSWSYLLYYRGH